MTPPASNPPTPTGPDRRPYLSLIRPWRVQPARELARTRILRLVMQRMESASHPGRGGDFTVVECPDWINVVPLTPDGHVVMIEQFRFGTAEVTLELPGGVVDPGESPAHACERELLEETGYAGDPVRMIGRVSANPAMLNNHVHTGLITNCRPVPSSTTNPDGDEEIAVRLVPRAEIPALIRAGVIHHSLVVAALMHLELIEAR
jgi:8-oxo-dGTP pyrophosphatase MutT (NUDIX family)